MTLGGGDGQEGQGLAVGKVTCGVGQAVCEAGLYSFISSAFEGGLSAFLRFTFLIYMEDIRTSK